MVPTVCLMLVIVACVASAILAVKRYYFWAILLLLAADVFIVLPLNATAGLMGESWGELSVPQKVVYMISLECWSDAETGAIVANALGPLAPLFNFMFTLLCIATPVVAGVAAYSIVTQRFSNWWVALRIKAHCKLPWKKGPIYLFEGINGRNLTYIRSIYGEDDPKSSSRASVARRLCVITGVSKEMKERSSTEIESIRDWPISMTALSAYELCSRVAKYLPEMTELRVCFFAQHQDAIGDSEGENVSDAVQLVELLAENLPLEGEGGFSRFSGEGTPRYHVYAACRGKSDELIFDSVKNSEGIDVRVVDEAREVIYNLLWHHPLHEVLGASGERFVECGSSLQDDAISDGVEKNLIVAVFGWGNYGFEAIRTCAWCGQIPGVRLHIHIVDKRPEEEFERYAEHYCPGFFQSVKDGRRDVNESAAHRIDKSDLTNGSSACLRQESSLFDYTYFQADARSRDFDECIKAIRRHCIDASASKMAGELLVPYCIVTLGDDDINTDAVIDIKRLFCGNGELPAITPRIFVDIYDTRRHKTLRKLLLPQKGGTSQPGQSIAFEPFGGIDGIFTEKYLARSDVEMLALNVNASYAEKFNPNGWLGEKVLLPSDAEERKNNYLEFSRWQVFRLSNIANAMSLKQKLWLLGYELSEVETADSNAQAQLQEKLDNGIGEYKGPSPVGERSALEVMARSEHDRWVAFYLSEGWTHESPKTSNTFKEWGLNDTDKTRHDSHLLLRHPYICEFDDLPDVAKEIGKGDPTTHDVNFIKDIVRIATDERGFSQRPFGIVKAC